MVVRYTQRVGRFSEMADGLTWAGGAFCLSWTSSPVWKEGAHPLLKGLGDRSSEKDLSSLVLQFYQTPGLWVVNDQNGTRCGQIWRG